MHRKSVKKGFEFTLMVVGKCYDIRWLFKKLMACLYKGYFMHHCFWLSTKEVITMWQIKSFLFTCMKGIYMYLQSRGYSQKNYWEGVCDLLPKTISLFMTRICNFSYPIYELTKTFISYLWLLQLAQLPWT